MFYYLNIKIKSKCSSVKYLTEMYFYGNTVGNVKICEFTTTSSQTVTNLLSIHNIIKQLI